MGKHRNITRTEKEIQSYKDYNGRENNDTYTVYREKAVVRKFSELLVPERN